MGTYQFCNWLGCSSGAHRPLVPGASNFNSHDFQESSEWKWPLPTYIFKTSWKRCPHQEVHPRNRQKHVALATHGAERKQWRIKHRKFSVYATWQPLFKNSKNRACHKVYFDGWVSDTHLISVIGHEKSQNKWNMISCSITKHYYDLVLSRLPNYRNHCFFPRTNQK